MPAGNLFLQQPTEFHFEGVVVGGHAEVQIEETVIDGLERQAEAQLPVDLALHLGEAGHGTDGHKSSSQFPVVRSYLINRF